MDHLQPAPATSPGDLGEGAELWSSRGLNLNVLPRCDNRMNPTLINVIANGSNVLLSEGVAFLNPPLLEPNQEPRPIWFWKVDATFGAWCFRAIHRAGAQRIPLTAAYLRALPAIRAVIEEQSPEAWAEVERRAVLSEPVKLPGAEILNILINHARYGLCPKWLGWEKDAAKLDAAEERARIEAEAISRPSEAVETASREAVTRQPCSAQRGRSKPRQTPAAGPGLFG